MVTASRSIPRVLALFLAPSLALLPAACDTLPVSELPDGFEVVGDTGTSLPGGAFASPEGVAVADGLAFVANSNVSYSGQSLVFGPGFVTVVRLSDGTVLDRVPVAARNPQAVAAAGSRVVVACSGATVLGTDASGQPLVRPAGDGSVVVLDAAAAAAGRSAFVREIPLPRSATQPLVGYPSSLALSADGRRAWLGSGTAPAVFVVDLDAGAVQNGADAPIALGDLAVQDTVVVRNGPDGTLLAGRFETDQVLVLDPAASAAAATAVLSPSSPVALDVGTPGVSDGLMDLAVRAGAHPDVYALLALASSITALDTGSGPAGVRNGFARTGTYPNRLVRDGDRLAVVNSGDNNVVFLDAATGASLRTIAFDPGTDPYDLALFARDGRSFAAVTGQQVDTLFVVDLDAGTTQAVK